MFRLKHIPTGLYYQPHKHGGSHLSKKGKIYQNTSHGLSEAFNNKREFFCVNCNKNSQVYKLTKDILSWKETRGGGWNQVIALTKTSDWVIENIEIKG